ncbi:MAG: hypothetical protein SFV21_12575 [Rhodospirillaceae bacterium]|nr:hypothetical protein [Rhodospirillaceae bacterium]
MTARHPRAKAAPGPKDTIAVVTCAATGLPAIYMRTRDGREFEHPLSVDHALALSRALFDAATADFASIHHPPAHPSDVLPANAVPGGNDVHVRPCGPSAPN